MREVYETLVGELDKYVVGYKDLLKLMIVALLSEGHILVEGFPGTGKTVTARLLSMTIGGVFRRIHMTPDLLPSDIIGSYYYDIGRGEWVLRQGPIFSNILLVDEINRAPPRTQTALLEAMQEGKVSIEGRLYDLPKPFLVIATQMTSPGEGIYNLTPALLDRFAYSYRTTYPDPESEIEILRRVDSIDDTLRSGKLSNILNPSVIVETQKIIREIYVSDYVKKYIVDLVNKIRENTELLIPPSPRTSIWLLKGSRVLAYLEGSDYVAPDHVKMISEYVILHRIILKPEAELRNVKPRDILDRALREVPVPKI
ncbi:MAG: MoxR family ATPase [Sulfolobales archaeon]